MRLTICCAFAVVVLALATACGAGSESPAQNARTSASQVQPVPVSPVTTSEQPSAESKPQLTQSRRPGPADTGQSGSLLDALGLTARRKLPDGLIVGGDCPAVGPDGDAEIAAQASSRVPLKVGLTLTNVWKPNPDEEYECLSQIVTIDPEGYVFSIGCTNPDHAEIKHRRVCRSDLRGARMLHTQVGAVEVIGASGESLPETIVGATEFSLSSAAFAELKHRGSTAHRYVQIDGAGRLAIEGTTVLRLEGTGSAPVTVNYTTIDVPVIRASGEAEFLRWGSSVKGRIATLVLDDERFPLLVDYKHTTDSSDLPDFRLNFARISYPENDTSSRESTQGGRSSDRASAEGLPQQTVGDGGGEMERRLSEQRRVDVYGIYFDFNSARIRKESEPVLNEIADVLRRNADWSLSIDGHTDNVGGDTYNRELSHRRSESVRKALVERHGIATTRLTTAGHGAAAPKDTNDTPEGRARNRRVELVRR